MIFPWLPNVLMDDLDIIELYTILLSVVGLISASVIYQSEKFERKIKHKV